MNTMNEEPDAVENSAYNPFPEPQTIPAGWDLSEMLSPLPVFVIDESETVES